MRGQKTAAWRLDLDVIVPRAASVDCGHNGSKAVCAVGSGDDMSAISKTYVVVLALLVRMPQINHCPGKRAAASGQHKAGKFSTAGVSAWLAQVTALWRFWLEKRSWRTVGSSPSRQEGVGASSCARAVFARESSQPAARMPVFSRNRRRVGFDGLFINSTKAVPKLEMLPPL